jgi:hypothetical protein
MEDKMKWYDWLAFILVIVGALNWGLVGLLNLDLVSYAFGGMTLTSKIIYAFIGASALYMTFGMVYVATKNKK